MSKPLPTYQMEQLLYENHRWLPLIETDPDAATDEDSTVNDLRVF